jgi:hypothetical protein
MPREHERVPFLIEAELECASGRQQARISDLSIGGCYIDSIALVKTGEAVSFDINAPDGPLRFNGTVAYVLDGSGFGVKFDQLPDTQREFVEDRLSSDST